MITCIFVWIFPSLSTLFFRQLCVLLDPEVLLRALSELLMDFDDVVYKRRIVDMLNTIVMTTSELHSLRIRLKDMKTEVR